MKEAVTSQLKLDAKDSKKPVCSLCGAPATETVDGEPSCAAHIGQIYANIRSRTTPGSISSITSGSSSESNRGPEPRKRGALSPKAPFRQFHFPKPTVPARNFERSYI